MKKGLHLIIVFLFLIGCKSAHDEKGIINNTNTQPRTFKLALIQMHVKGGEKQWNIEHAIDLIDEAAVNGAEVALLPECMDIGWMHPSGSELAEPIPGGEPCRTLMKIAKEKNIYICAGLTERSGNRIFNSAVLIDKHGILLGKHRKLNEVADGHEFYALGDRLNVFDTEYGTFGILICADGFAKDRVLTRSLCYMGADVILSPSAWAVSADHDNVANPYGGFWRYHYIPVAREFSTAIFAASNVGWITDGPWKGEKCIGCSLAFGPNGEEILQGPYGVDAECILYVDVEPVERPARGTDWE